MQETENPGGTGEPAPSNSPPPAAVTPPSQTPIPTKVGEEEVEEGREGEDPCPTHLSSGYASSDSSGAGVAQAATPLPGGEAVLPLSSIQSDPHQSAFRPAMPAHHQQMYPGMDGGQQQQQVEYQYRNGGITGWQGGGDRVTGWEGGGGRVGGWQEGGGRVGGWDGGEQQVGYILPQHIQQMHQPIARRPITGNSYGHSQAYARPTHYQSSPAPGPPPPPGQMMAAPANKQPQYAPPAGGWGSPSWSGTGAPPPAPPPISMTPPPISWGQPPGGARIQPRMQQTNGGGGRNKPFGNIAYTQQVSMPKQRSKNYPFPTRTQHQDCGDDMYGGRGQEACRGGEGGGLDNMRTLEQYLPEGGAPPPPRNYEHGQKGEEGLLNESGSSGFYSSRSSPRSHPALGPSYDPNSGERFSRKVFVGGLPPDIDEDEITASFRRFGPLVVDWPHKAESKSYFPPKGYAFLLFQDEVSVQELIEVCIQDEDKLYLCVSSPTIKDKPVQIRPWKLSDADFVLDASLPLDPRKTVFVGGVPRPLKAVELAMIMDRLYGGVCYAGIDTDPELKYPKGAGRVAFSNQQSYIAAISARFVQLQHGEIDKRVEVKPYVLDDQLCDECQGARCGGKFAPFFCANVTCLQYYCEQCWASIHSRPGREFHKPLVKEGADRPRAVPFRWC